MESKLLEISLRMNRAITFKYLGENFSQLLWQLLHLEHFPLQV